MNPFLIVPMLALSASVNPGSVETRPQPPEDAPHAPERPSGVPSDMVAPTLRRGAAKGRRGMWP